MLFGGTAVYEGRGTSQEVASSDPSDPYTTFTQQKMPSLFMNSKYPFVGADLVGLSVEESPIAAYRLP